MLDAGIAKNKVPREGEFCNGPNGRDKRLMRVLELFDDLVQGGQVFLKLYFCCLFFAAFCASSSSFFACASATTHND